MASIEERLKEIVAKQLKVTPDKISMDTSFVDDLGADSLDIAELVMEFEDEFDLNIPESEKGIKTFGDAVNYIKEHIKE